MSNMGRVDAIAGDPDAGCASGPVLKHLRSVLVPNSRKQWVGGFVEAFVCYQYMH